MPRNRALFSLGGIILGSLFLLNCKHSAIQFTAIGPIEHPSDNPFSTTKIALGRALFFDPRLSRTNSVSCATCHIPELAFTDGKTVSEGVEGRKTMRNSPSILNAAFLKTVMFDAHLPTLEMQVIVPIQEHTEMDMNMQELIAKLRQIPEYANASESIFQRPFDAFVLSRAIAAFERTLVSTNSRFDRYYFDGQQTALTKSEVKGWKLFSGKLHCIRCHPAPFFTTFQAENNGLYAEYPIDKGRFRVSDDSTDIGKFKIPSLRNVELTAPYMHDGSLATLWDVIQHYEQGGSGHTNQSPILEPFKLSTQEKVDLRNFLQTLTDTTYLKDF